jgi:hypothetical protein
VEVEDFGVSAVQPTPKEHAISNKAKRFSYFIRVVSICVLNILVFHVRLSVETRQAAACSNLDAGIPRAAAGTRQLDVSLDLMKW